MDSNSYLVAEDGHAVIIDGSSWEGVQEKIEEHGWTVDYLLLTHEHFDHIWYLEDLRQTYHMPVVASRLCSERIGDVKSNLSNIADILYYFKTGIVREGTSPSFTCGPADIVYEEDFELGWREHRFTFRRIPGHAPGCVLITLDQDAADAADAEGGANAGGSWVFTGDYMIWGEEEILRLKDGSREDYEALARPVLEQIPPGTKIAPGHGPAYIMGKAEEQEAERLLDEEGNTIE